MAGFNYVDFVLIAILLLSVISGFSRGLVREIFSVFVLSAAFVVAVMFSVTFSDYLMHLPSVQPMIDSSSSAVGTSTAEPVTRFVMALAFALLFAGTWIVGGILFWLIAAIFCRSASGIGSRFLGGCFGGIKGVALLLAIMFVIQLTPLSAEAWWGESRVVQESQPIVVALAGFVSPTLSDMKEKIGNATKGAEAEAAKPAEDVPVESAGDE